MFSLFLCLSVMYYLCEKYYNSIPVGYRIADCVSWVSRLTLLDLGLSSGLLKWSSFTCRGPWDPGASWLVIAWPQRVGLGRGTPTSQAEGAEAPGSDPPGAHTACLSFDWSLGVCEPSRCSCIWFLATPWTVALQPSVHGILQARILECAAMLSSRGSSWPRDRTHLSDVACISRQVL